MCYLSLLCYFTKSFTDNVKEDFIGFCNVTGNTTGENIADVIIEKLESTDLNLSNVRAQAYDGIGDSVF